MWTFRAWDYGLSTGLFFALVFHLPVILVLWPRIIWRKNWLFGVVPAAVLVVGAFVLNMAGTSERHGGLMMEDGVLVPPPEVERGGVGRRMCAGSWCVLSAVGLAGGRGPLRHDPAASAALLWS